MQIGQLVLVVEVAEGAVRHHLVMRAEYQSHDAAALNRMDALFAKGGTVFYRPMGLTLTPHFCGLFLKVLSAQKYNFF